MISILEMQEAAQRIRIDILRVAAEGKKSTHIGSCLSIVEILVTLFLRILRPQDIFVLSKGHGGLGYYAVLKEVGLLNEEQLYSFESDGGELGCHPSRLPQAGIVYSSGSLGMGLSYVCGLALASKLKNEDKRYYVLLGDGECNEGSVYEAACFASQNMLNITIVVDKNELQADGLTSNIINIDIKRLLQSLGINTISCDGHSFEYLLQACEIIDRPLAIVANTIKGKGVSFMENNNDWHHKPLVREKFEQAKREILLNEH